MRRALIVTTLALACTAQRAEPAADCPGLASLAAAFAAASASLESARATLTARGDVRAALLAGHDAIVAAGTALSAGATQSPAELLAPQPRLVARLAAAQKSVMRAQRHAGRARLVRLRLAAATRSLDRATAILADVVAGAVCAVVVDPPGGPLTVFPADNWWNVDVTARPVLANSDATVDFIGRGKPLHADFGTTFGIPYIVLDTAQPLTPLTFGYDDESDHGIPGGATGYPIPPAAKTTAGLIEGGVAGGGTSGDRHLLLVDRTTNFLFEIYAAQWTGTAWKAGSGAIFDLASNARRPDGWTSADAAGLAIFPGLVRADEVFDKGEIRHALRFTVRATQGYVYPASHDATHGSGGASRPPLGLRMRLKASVDLSTFSAPARVVLTAMKKYGLILADNGSDWFVSGAPDSRWDDERMHDDFARITGNDLEAIE